MKWPPMSSVNESWQRIRTWIKSNTEELASFFPGPAEEFAIAASEAAMSVSFPDDLRESFLAQNGLEYGEQELNIFPTPPEAFDEMAFCLLPIDAVAQEWKVWKDLIDGGQFTDSKGVPDDGITSDWWSDGWIPVAGNGGGDFICVDMKPDKGGTIGQVICAWHDSEERQLLASSWSSYLNSLADEMESGKLTYTEDEGLIRE